MRGDIWVVLSLMRCWYGGAISLASVVSVYVLRVCIACMHCVYILRVHIACTYCVHILRVCVDKWINGIFGNDDQ